MAPDDFATLRLITLRLLVRDTAAPIIFDVAVAIGEVERVLREQPEATAIFVDGGVLQGTLRLEDLFAIDPAERAENVMSREAPVIVAENDLAAAQRAMAASHANRIVVVNPAGELLGVLTEWDLLRSAA